MPIVRYIVDVDVDETTWDGDTLSGEDLIRAGYDMFDQIVTGDDDWYPRGYILCDEEFSIMGENPRCEKEYGHLGFHGVRND